MLRVVTILALASTLVAAGVNLDGRDGYSVQATTILSPTLTILALIVAMILSLGRNAARPTTNSDGHETAWEPQLPR